MDIRKLTVTLIGVIGLTSIAHAETAPMPPDPLANLQGVFGTIVGDAFHRPDPIIAAVSQPGSPATQIGFALRSSLEAPGAVFAAVMQPFADKPVAVVPVAAAPEAAAPLRHRHARLRHRRMSSHV